MPGVLPLLPAAWFFPLFSLLFLNHTVGSAITVIGSSVAISRTVLHPYIPYKRIDAFSTKAIFPKTEQIASWNLFPNQRKIKPMQNTVWKLMECIVARELARDLEDKEIISCKLGRGKRHMGKCSCICRWRVRRIPEERTNSGCDIRSRACSQQSPVQAAGGTVHAIWNEPNTDPVSCRSAPGKNGGYTAWKVELCSSSAHNGPTTRITALASILHCLHQRPGRKV